MIPAAYTNAELAAKFRAAAAKALRGHGWRYALAREGVDLAACDWFGHVFSERPKLSSDYDPRPVWETSKDRATALALAAYLIELDEDFG